MVLAAGLELAKVGESLNHGARDLWETSESITSNGAGSSSPEGRKHQRHLSEEERTERWTVMLTTIGFLLAFKNDGVGFLAGMLCHGFYHSENIANSIWSGLSGGLGVLVERWNDWGRRGSEWDLRRLRGETGRDGQRRPVRVRGNSRNGRMRSRQATTVEEEEALLSEGEQRT